MSSIFFNPVPYVHKRDPMAYSFWRITALSDTRASSRVEKANASRRRATAPPRRAPPTLGEVRNGRVGGNHEFQVLHDRGRIHEAVRFIEGRVLGYQAQYDKTSPMQQAASSRT